MRISHLFATLLPIVPVTIALSQSPMNVPTIPLEFHVDLNVAMELDAEESRLAQLAYSGYVREKEVIDDTHAMNARHVTGLYPEAFEANDTTFSAAINESLSDASVRWYRAIREVENTYFDALIAIRDQSRDAVLRSRQEWAGLWILSSEEVRSNKQHRALINLAVVAYDESDGPISDQVAEILRDYKTRIGSAYDELARAILRPRSAVNLSPVLAEIRNGDIQHATEIAEETLRERYLVDEIVDQIARMNVGFYWRLVEAYEWTAGMRFRARVLPELYAHVAPNGFQFAETKFVACAASDVGAERQMTAQSIDEQYTKRIAPLLQQLQVHYDAEGSFEAIIRARAASIMSQLGSPTSKAASLPIPTPEQRAIELRMQKVTNDAMTAIQEMEKK